MGLALFLYSWITHFWKVFPFLTIIPFSFFCSTNPSLLRVCRGRATLSNSSLHIAFPKHPYILSSTTVLASKWWKSWVKLPSNRRNCPIRVSRVLFSSHGFRSTIGIVHIADLVEAHITIINHIHSKSFHTRLEHINFGQMNEKGFDSCIDLYPMNKVVCLDDIYKMNGFNH